MAHIDHHTDESHWDALDVETARDGAQRLAERVDETERVSFRVVKEASPAGEAEWIAFEIGCSKPQDPFDMDNGPRLGGVGAALYDEFEARIAGDAGRLSKANERLHTACLVAAHKIAAGRTALLCVVRAICEHIHFATIKAGTDEANLRVRRAVSDLAGRLHGLTHIALLPAHTAGAQAATVTDHWPVSV